MILLSKASNRIDCSNENSSSYNDNNVHNISTSKPGEYSSSSKLNNGNSNGNNHVSNLLNHNEDCDDESKLILLSIILPKLSTHNCAVHNKDNCTHNCSVLILYSDCFILHNTNIVNTNVSILILLRKQSTSTPNIESNNNIYDVSIGSGSGNNNDNTMSVLILLSTLSNRLHETVFVLSSKLSQCNDKDYNNTHALILLLNLVLSLLSKHNHDDDDDDDDDDLYNYKDKTNNDNTVRNKEEQNGTSIYNLSLCVLSTVSIRLSSFTSEHRQEEEDGRNKKNVISVALIDGECV